MDRLPLAEWSSVDQHLDCFHILAATKSTSLDICGQVLCDHLFSILWGCIVRNEFLGHMVTVCLACLRILPVPFYVPTSSRPGIRFSHTRASHPCFLSVCVFVTAIAVGCRAPSPGSLCWGLLAPASRVLQSVPLEMRDLQPRLILRSLFTLSPGLDQVPSVVQLGPTASLA